MPRDPKEVELPYANMRYEEPIVHIVFKDGAELGFPEIRELTSHAEKLSDNRPYFVFSDVRVNVKVTPEGRKIASDIKEAPLHRGSAILVNNDMLKLAINFFNGLKKPEFPYRAFTDEQNAMDWLSQLSNTPPKNTDLG